jgi:hypothetical protein
MANQTLRDLIVAYAGKSATVAEVMDHLVKKSGILKTALAIPANYNIYHKYKKVAALPTFTVGGMNQDLTDVTVNKDLFQQELASIDAIQTEYKKELDNYPGGSTKFFADQFLAFIEGWGQAAAKQVIYGTSGLGDASGTIGLHQIAAAYGNVIVETGTSGSTTSIFAVKYDPKSCGILYNPSAGKFLNVTKLHGGSAYPEVINDGGSDGSKKLVYGTSYESSLGFLSASKHDVATYTRIQDDTGDKPTSSNMDKLIDMVHGDEGSTFLYCNRTAKRLLRELKDSKLSMGVFDKNYDVRIDYWNGIPIIVDENIVDTESTTNIV